MYTHCSDCDEELATLAEQAIGLCVLCNPEEDGSGPSDERYQPLNFDLEPPRDYAPEHEPWEPYEDEVEFDDEYEHQLEMDFDIPKG